MPPPTIRQVAAAAGVSRTAVSLALRNSPSLALATRQRIQKVAEAMGYRQDPVVATLMSRLRVSRVRRSAERIAYLTDWEPFEGWQDSYINDGYFLNGARRRANQLGYEVDHIWSRAPGMTPRRLSRILHTRAIKGVIFAPVFSPPWEQELEWPHFATATIGYAVTNRAMHRATHSHYDGMAMALDELAKLGYRRFGYATLSDQDDRVNHHWLAALLTRQRALPAEDAVPPLLAPRLDAAVIKNWIQTHRPDVVISNWPDVPVLMREAGFEIPGDIGFASLDLDPGRHTLAGVDQLPEAVGAAVADVVVKQVQNNEFGLPAHPVRMMIEGVWVPGPTVRALNMSPTRKGRSGKAPRAGRRR